MSTKNNKEIVKENIEEAIIKNTVHIDGRMTLTGTDFNRLVEDLLSLIPEQGEVVCEGEIEEIGHSQVHNTYIIRVKNVTHYDFLDNIDKRVQIIIKQKHNGVVEDD